MSKLTNRMTRNERFALQLSGCWLTLMSNFVALELSPSQRRGLLAKRNQMEDAARLLAPDGNAAYEAVDLLCGCLGSGLNPFKTHTEDGQAKD
jgi:hypothetical protein